MVSAARKQTGRVTGHSHEPGSPSAQWGWEMQTFQGLEGEVSVTVWWATAAVTALLFHHWESKVLSNIAVSPLDSSYRTRKKAFSIQLCSSDVPSKAASGSRAEAGTCWGPARLRAARLSCPRWPCVVGQKFTLQIQESSETLTRALGASPSQEFIWQSQSVLAGPGAAPRC